MSKKLIFITATDTGVGKTITTAILGLTYQLQGQKVGVLKPVQCAGQDAVYLKKTLCLDDELTLINPFFLSEPLSPHLAFRRSQKSFELKKIKSAIGQLIAKYDVLLIEGAGGLMVPLKDNYFVADLVRDLKAELIIVSRLGLGSINHSLLTINQAKANQLKIKGLIFSDISKKAKTLPETTNPIEIARLSKVKVLGIIPYLKSKTRKSLINVCKSIKLSV